MGRCFELFLAFLLCIGWCFRFCKNSLQKKLCGNPTPRHHNSPESEMEQGQVVATAEHPAPAKPEEKKEEEDSGYKFRNPDNWAHI
ncbi:unnamed protein product [Caenorhabditis nigoni]